MRRGASSFVSRDAKQHIPVIKLFGAALVATLAILGTLGPLKSSAQGPGMSRGGDPLAATAWRPNQKGATYVGPKACAKCHEAETSQRATAMGRAMEPAAVSAILRANPRLTFRSGVYSYEIKRLGEQSLYTVSDGTHTFSEPILYSFGQGKAGQTYIFRHNGELHESRVSFYRDLKGLDWTMGYQLALPSSLDDAVGRAIKLNEARECFACHSTAAINGLDLQLEHLIPGITCEACHGPGRDHIAAMEGKRLNDKHIFNPGTMEADELAQEFCGSCHHSAEQVMTNNQPQGPIRVRFQPYRLYTSRGHDPDDARLRCTACHNPHEDPVQEPAFYDPKCLACHHAAASLKSTAEAKAEENEGRTAKACPVAQRLCVSCHMPRVEVPGTHFKFTDHRIRIAKAGEPFPN
jgi:hypothetical protein